MISTAIKKITEQQKGKEDTAPFYVGEQLKDIIKNNPAAAEIVAADLDVKEMSIDNCEKKIKEYADKHKKGNFVCVPPPVAEKIIVEFYGIPQKEPEKSSKPVSLFDMI